MTLQLAIGRFAGAGKTFSGRTKRRLVITHSPVPRERGDEREQKTRELEKGRESPDHHVCSSRTILAREARRTRRMRVDLVHLVCLVHLVSLVPSNKPNKRERPAGPRVTRVTVPGRSRTSVKGKVKQRPQWFPKMGPLCTSGWRC